MRIDRHSWNFKILHIFFTALLLFAVSCQSSSSDGGTDVGSIANKPRPPSNNLFPDFDTYFSDTTLGSETVSSVVPGVLQFLKSFSLIKIAIAQTQSIYVPDLWNRVILAGSIYEVHRERKNLTDFGTSLATLAAEQSITEATSSIQKIVQSVSTKFIDTDAIWEVEVQVDATDSDYVRFYFRNTQTGLYQATYFVKSDSSGNPVKGLLAYVNPENMTTTATSGKRFLAFAFDLSDPAKNLTVVREELFYSELNRFYAFHFHQQCNSSTQTCLGEYDELSTATGERLLAYLDARFSWNESTNDVCLGDVDYSDGTVRILSTAQFKGPTTPSADQIEENTCVLETPHWGEHVYTASDLPYLYEDTTPGGGTAVQYFVDGVVKTGWDTLTPSLIDGWLDASAF